jgi:hypothetical protein
MATVEELAKGRKIGSLVHFTRVENLAGILTHGLLPRTQYDAYGVAPVLTDELRLDSCLEASSLSIGFPNYKMFFYCQKSMPEAKWAVVVYKPNILWEKKCAFCTENAAKSGVAAIPIAERTTPRAFEAMFDEVAGKPNRKKLGLDDGSPTNPQAEVLVFGRIESTYVIGVAFKEQALVDAHRERFRNVPMKRLPGLFLPRVDYLHWKKV